MKVFLSQNNNQFVIQFPITPSQIIINSPEKHIKLDTTKGELNLIGLRGLKTVTISAIFPNDDYYFVDNVKYLAEDYCNLIEQLRDTRRPFRFLLSDSDINFPVLIDNFEYGYADGTKDIYYTLQLSEFKFAEVKEV